MCRMPPRECRQNGHDIHSVLSVTARQEGILKGTSGEDVYFVLPRPPVGRRVISRSQSNQQRCLMKINLFRRQTLGAWAVVAFLAATIAIGVSNLFSADEPSAPKSDNFSPYVAED